MTRITLETIDGKYSIETPRDDLDIDGAIDCLIEPLLLAAGYHPDTVARAFSEETEYAITEKGKEELEHHGIIH